MSTRAELEYFQVRSIYRVGGTYEILLNVADIIKRSI